MLKAFAKHSVQTIGSSEAAETVRRIHGGILG